MQIFALCQKRKMGRFESQKRKSANFWEGVTSKEIVEKQSLKFELSFVFENRFRKSIKAFVSLKGESF